MNNNIQELKHTFGKLTTPVLFVIFNRPDTTQQVFNVIRRVNLPFGTSLVVIARRV
jgi:hypothetical protein